MAEYKNNNQQNEDGALDWDEVIESDGQNFALIPEDDYNFTVTHFERGHFDGSNGMKACNKATLTLRVETPDGVYNVREVLFLNTMFESRIGGFFRSIGRKKDGERFVMNWSNLEGERGRAHFRPREYTDRNGNDRECNSVAWYITYNPIYFENESTDDGDLPF